MAREFGLSRWALWLSIGIASILSSACESRPPTDTGEEAAVPLRITAITIGTPISTLVVEVTAADLPTALVFNLAVESGVASGTIRIPPGPARTLHVSAEDDQGNVTHEGSVMLDVKPGQNPPIEVVLRPRSGQVPITVTFGNYTVLVTPASAMIDGPATTQVQLTVTVIDVDGQQVATPEVGWATTHPAVATVSGIGLVTGVTDGVATIVATYEGVAALSVVTVTGLGGPNAGSPETCDGVDNDLDGQIDEGLRYCLSGVAAPHTNGAVCLPGFQDLDGEVQNGCEGGVPTEVTLFPSALTITASGTGVLFVTVSAMAPPGGLSVILTSDNNSLVTVPSVVMIPEGTTIASFSAQGVAPGEVLVTASLGGSSATSTVTVVAP